MTDIAGRSLHFDFADYWLGFLVNLVQTMHRTNYFPHDPIFAVQSKNSDLVFPPRGRGILPFDDGKQKMRQFGVWTSIYVRQRLID